MRRERIVRVVMRRSASVVGGEVDTVYSTVVGEGRRVSRCGVVVSMTEGLLCMLPS